MMRYQIETFSLADGWVNTWTEPAERRDNIYPERPVTFATHLEAVAALNVYWVDLQHQVAMGDVMPYDRDDFRVVQIEVEDREIHTRQIFPACDRARLSRAPTH
jgi:hypothetical protein